MARRTLINIEGKILDATVSKGAKYGVDNVSTIQIAKKCNITEPTIFVHFKTKSNLLLQAYLYVDKIAEEKLFSCEEFKKESVDMYLVWEYMFDFFITNKKISKYFDSYRHYSFYNPTEINELSTHHIEACRKMLGNLKSYSDLELLLIWVHVVDSTVNFAIKAAEGKVSIDEESKRFIFKMITGGISK